MHGVQRGQLHHKKCPPHPLFVACPPSPPPSYDDFKTFPHLFATPSPINMTTMKRHHAQFPPTPSPP